MKTNTRRINEINEKYKQPIEKKLLYKINKNLPNVIKKNNEVISIEFPLIFA